MLFVLIRIASLLFTEDQKDFPKFSSFASSPGAMINHQGLELPMSRINSHCPKDVRATEVLLYRYCMFALKMELESHLKNILPGTGKQLGQSVQIWKLLTCNIPYHTHSGFGLCRETTVRLGHSRYPVNLKLYNPSTSAEIYVNI